MAQMKDNLLFSTISQLDRMYSFVPVVFAPVVLQLQKYLWVFSPFYLCTILSWYNVDICCHNKKSQSNTVQVNGSELAAGLHFYGPVVLEIMCFWTQTTHCYEARSQESTLLNKG